LGASNRPPICYVAVTTKRSMFREQYVELVVISFGIDQISGACRWPSLRQTSAFQVLLTCAAINLRSCPSCCRATEGGELRQHNILWIICFFTAATKSFPTSSGISISRDVASTASCPSAAKGSGIPLVRSSPSWRMTSSTLYEGVARATPFAWAVCTLPRLEPGRRRLITRLEQVASRAPEDCAKSMSNSSRLSPSATN
jgi:hypothetical protein